MNLPNIISSSLPNSQPTNAIMVPNRLLVRRSKAEGPLRRPGGPSKEVAPPLLTSMPPPPASSDSSAIAPRPFFPPTFRVLFWFCFQSYGYSGVLRGRMLRICKSTFEKKKAEELSTQGLVFGFTGKNEISNGRMFSLDVDSILKCNPGRIVGAKFLHQDVFSPDLDTGINDLKQVLWLLNTE